MLSQEDLGRLQAPYREAGELLGLLSAGLDQVLAVAKDQRPPPKR